MGELQRGGERKLSRNIAGQKQFKLEAPKEITQIFGKKKEYIKTKPNTVINQRPGN